MYQQKISTVESPRIEVTACQGDLVVTTWDESGTLIQVDDEEALTVEKQDEAVALVANGDCKLTVPTDASLVVVQVQGDFTMEGMVDTLEIAMVQGDAEMQRVAGDTNLGTVSGDLTVKGVDGSLTVQSVGGDARVYEATGGINLGTISGDLTAQDVGGDMTLATVAGDAYLRQLHGPISLGDISGDLVGRDWMAGADVAQVGGDVSLKTVFAGSHTYRIEARGNIAAKVFPGSSATFTLHAVGGRVQAKGLTGEMTENQWQGVAGEGEAQVSLSSSHGHVILKAVEEGEPGHAAFPFETNFGEMGARAGVAADELAWRIQQRVAEKLSKIDFESIARREAERARREADKSLRAAEKARRKAEHARRKAQRKVEWHIERPRSPEPPGYAGRRQRSQAVSEEERLAVLKMLAEGKISATEAETLLQALEG
jgi:hypothetical protein